MVSCRKCWVRPQSKWTAPKAFSNTAFSGRSAAVTVLPKLPARTGLPGLLWLPKLPGVARTGSGVHTASALARQAPVALFDGFP